MNLSTYICCKLSNLGCNNCRLMDGQTLANWFWTSSKSCRMVDRGDGIDRGDRAYRADRAAFSTSGLISSSAHLLLASISVHCIYFHPFFFHPLSSTCIYIHPLSSISINCHPLSSTNISYKSKKGRAVISPTWVIPPESRLLKMGSLVGFYYQTMVFMFMSVFR